MVNSKQTTSDTKTRTLLIIVGLMVLIGVLVAIYSFKSKDSKAVAATSGIPANIRITPGVKSSEKYVELQQSANMLGTKKAEAKGKNFVPTIVANKSEESSKNFACQISNIIEEQDKSDPNRLSKQLALMLADLSNNGGNIDNLINLAKELQHQGYDVTDLEETSRKLQEDGYNTDPLQQVLQKLKNQGYQIEDMQKMLQDLLKNGNNNPKIINNLLDQVQKDKLKTIDDLQNQLEDNGFTSDELGELVKQTNSPELEKLIAQLGNQGYKTNSLSSLLKQLADRGYNISNPEKLLKQLAKDGYDTTGLQELLTNLKNDKKDVSDWKNLVKGLTRKKGNLSSTSKNKAQRNTNVTADGNKNSTEQLSDIFNQTTNNNHLPNIDQEYAALLKKQQDAAIAEEKNIKLEEQKMINEQKALLNSEAQQQAIAAMVNNMQAQLDASNLIVDKVPAQNFIQGDFAPGKEDSNKSNKQENQKNNSYFMPEKATTNNIIIKAGTILFAILETGINTDEPGPILARIVQAPLKNTKLIGNVQSSGNQFTEKLTLNFSTANIPSKIRSYGISAVAIDPNTSRTAIASDVDHHYLLRWGTIMAASFLQGYSQAVAQSGTTVSSTNTGSQVNTTTQTSPLNPRQQIFKGIGEMVTTWGQGVQSFTNRPNTIRVHAGTSIGILLTSDFSLPAGDDVPIDLPQPQLPPSPYGKENLLQASQNQLGTTNNTLAQTNTTVANPNQTNTDLPNQTPIMSSVTSNAKTVQNNNITGAQTTNNTNNNGK